MIDQPVSSGDKPIGVCEEVMPDGTIVVALDLNHPIVQRMVIANFVGGIAAVNESLKRDQAVHGN